MHKSNDNNTENKQETELNVISTLLLHVIIKEVYRKKLVPIAIRSQTNFK